MTKIAYKSVNPSDEKAAAIEANNFLKAVAQQSRKLVSAKGAQVVLDDLLTNELMAAELEGTDVHRVWNTGVTRPVRGNVYFGDVNYRFTFPANQQAAALKAGQIRQDVAARKGPFETLENTLGIVNRIASYDPELMGNALAGTDFEAIWSNQANNSRRGKVKIYDLPEE